MSKYIIILTLSFYIQPTVATMRLLHPLLRTGLSYSLFSTLLLYAAFATASVSPPELEQTILILDRARTNGISELQSDLAEKKLTKEEEREYRTFLNYLTRRIHHYCRELKLTIAAADFEKLPCNYAETEQLPEYTSLPSPPSETETVSEELDSLDNSLQQSLGQFDEMLLRENEQIALQKSTQSQGGTSSNGDNESASASSGTGSKSGDPSTDTKSSESTNQSEIRTDTEHTGKNDQKKSPGLAKDDDIVARQLREAAEKETDPEIKEKLWEEYRKYKEGVR